MKFLGRRSQAAEQARAEKVSRAVEAPGMQWDQGTREVAAVGRLLESGIAPDEAERSKRKAAMLAEFARKHSRPAVNGTSPVIISDIEPISDEDAEVIAARFEAFIASASHKS